MEAIVAGNLSPGVMGSGLVTRNNLVMDTEVDSIID